MNRDAAVLGGGAAVRPLFMALLALGLMLIYAPVIYLLLASFNPGRQLGIEPAPANHPS
jgi:ABC-type spermidine/putrescine transport system permease subunit II